MDTLKTAQIRCLSMDLLSPKAVEDIFDAVIDWAFQKQMRLLITHSLDLFMIKVS